MVDNAKSITYRFGSFVLDLVRGALYAADGRELPLRPKSFALLQFLVENAGRLVSQDAIMTALWPDIYVTENNVTKCIGDVRRALGPAAHQTLRTVSRRGYLFTPAVTEEPWVRNGFRNYCGSAAPGGDGSMPLNVKHNCVDESSLVAEKPVRPPPHSRSRSMGEAGLANSTFIPRLTSGYV
jgi:DNA-binding winged helix-turn-helix (wHTH) protein